MKTQKARIPYSVPIVIRWVFDLFVIFMLIFTVLRIATLILFMPENTKVAEVLPSFSLGFIYDIRWVSILLLPVVLCSLIPRFSPFYSKRNKRFWSYYLVACTLFVLFFFGADFGNFSYNHTRLNASALNFAEDPVISLKMLWQSYPLVWILMALLLTVYLLHQLFKRTHFIASSRTTPEGGFWRKRAWFIIAIGFMSWSIYGLFSLKPLKWKDAFLLNNNFTAYLALNPLQNFFSTLQFRNPNFENEKAHDYYPLVSKFLNVTDQNGFNLNYDRFILPSNKAIETRPNIVLVISESFSMYKSSMSGNPLNTTPYFKQLCDSGLFFDRCFTPTFGTARGVFAILTGIPDVQLSKFSTRNPLAINQHTIINDFDGYQKFYFIGGNSGFNNFEGIVQNINQVHIYQEGSYQSQPFNVWGISDKDLFSEAVRDLSHQTKPFFAIIQTADNHRPFTIPDKDSDFIKREVPEDTLNKYGFESLKEFQAFCYTDYCFRHFMDDAKKQNWFDNTIFVFIGDHGVDGNTTSIYQAGQANLGKLANEHVPFLIYAPELIAPQRRSEVVSQIDVLPTIAGLVHQPYLNTTLGRDLLSPRKGADLAFIIHHDEGKIGLVNNQFLFTKNLQLNKEELWPLSAHAFSASPEQLDSTKKALSQYTSAIYETAKYMLLNNKKKSEKQ